MTTKQLKDLGFDIQAEQKRAVYWLNTDRTMSIIVDSDKQIVLNLDNMRSQINEVKDKLKAIKSLINMFETQQVIYPF